MAGEVSQPTPSQETRVGLPNLQTGLSSQLEVISGSSPHQGLEAIATGGPLIVGAERTDEIVPPTSAAPPTPPEAIGTAPIEQQQTPAKPPETTGANSQKPPESSPEEQPPKEGAEAKKTEAKQSTAPAEEGASEEGSVSPKPQEAEAPAKPPEATETAQVEQPEALAEQSQADELQQLEDKVKKGKAKEDDLRRYRKLKQEGKKQERLRELQGKMESGDFTDDEMTEYLKLKGEKEEEGESVSSEKTPEQKLNEAGDRLVEALVTGKNLQEAVEEFTKAQMEKEGLASLTNNELIRNAAEEVVKFLQANPSEVRKRLNKGEQRQLRFQKEIQERIKEIVRLEIQVASMPARMEALKKQASQVRAELLKRLPSLKKPLDDEQARKERMEFYGLLIQMGNLKAEAIKIRHAGEILSIQLADLRREVMAKSGMFKGVGGLIARFADWAATRGKEFLLDARMNFEGEFDFDYEGTTTSGGVGLSSL